MFASASVRKREKVLVREREEERPSESERYDFINNVEYKKK